jgi:hypothetical protein
LTCSGIIPGKSKNTQVEMHIIFLRRLLVQ